MNRVPFTYHLPLVLLFVLFSSISLMASPAEIDTTKSGSAIGLSSQTDDAEPYLTKEFTLNGPGILRVSTLAGNIEVERTADSNKVRIELYVDRGYAIWSNTKNLENYRITTLQRGNEILASVEQKSAKSGFFGDQMKFSYKIFVPQYMSSEMKTSAGDIILSGMEGQHMVKTGNGKIIAKNIQGKLGAYSASGNIRISHSSGTLYAQTEAGKLSVIDSQGEIRLKTNAGNVTAQRISGSLLAKTGSGNMEADFIAVSTGISLDTNSGNIRLSVPASFGYNLDLNGTRVQMTDGEMISGSRKKNEITGTVNGGGAAINLSTKSGEVTLDLEH